MLSRAQERAIIALLEQPNVSAAARVLKCSRAVLHGWLRDEAFQAALTARQQEVSMVALARAQALAGDAVETLREVMQSPLSTPSARVQAASRLLDVSVKKAGSDDISDRLEEIERVAAALVAGGELIGEQHW